MTRTDILNTLAKAFNYQSYLEIGVNDGINFSRVDVPGIKVGVDPKEGCPATHIMTSDEYFEYHHLAAPGDGTYKPTQDDPRHLDYDLIFVDGLHEADQCYEDIDNALYCLNQGGAIVVHDCNPQSYLDQLVPRVQSRWNGDVWKAWVKLRQERADLDMFVLDTDEGCGIIRWGKQKPLKIDGQISWQGLVENRKEWLNLKPASYLQEYISQITTI